MRQFSKNIWYLSLLVAVLGLVVFLFIATNAPFPERSSGSLFPKPASEAATNLLINPSFENGQGAWHNPWFLNLQSGGDATLSQDSINRSDGAVSARVTVHTPSSEAWHVQLAQTDLALTQNQIYTVSFDARASVNRSISAYIVQGVSPYALYFMQPFNITTSFQRYSFSFSAPANSPKNILAFNLALASGDVWIDNVVFVPSDTPPRNNPPTLPSAGAFSSGSYRNLFKEVGYPDSEIQNKVNAAWNQLFYGASHERVYIPVGTDMAYILTDSGEALTEGQSYGMMIAAQMDKRAEFDRLWKWTKTYMQHQDGVRKGYFAWHARTDGTKIDQNNASDGEVWIITALFLASNRWGDGTGIYNYKAEAQAILDAARSKESTSATTRVFDLFDPNTKLVRFVAEEMGTDRMMHTWTNPSYQAPAFYELWARMADKDNQFWSQAAVASRQFLAKTVNPSTGLMPNYANFDGTPHRCCPNGQGNSHNYGYDARRTHMNIANDYHWWGVDPWQVGQSDRIHNFFSNQGVTTHGAEYQLNGTPISNIHETGHVAMIASAGLAGSTSKTWDFVNHLWSQPIPTGQYRYYDGLLYLMGLLQVSGNFRLYTTASSTPAPTPVRITGDADNNGIVDIFDYNAVLRDFSKRGTGITGDADRNGVVDIFDYNAVLRDFGKRS